MIGAIVGAVMIVVLNPCFPQDHIAFVTLLALWLALCAFAATLMRNFASYSAALAGYTAAIIAADTLCATGGPDGQVFMLAVTRASEICIGIVCAGIVLAGTDFGGSRRQLAALFANLSTEITGRFAGMLAPGDHNCRTRELSDGNSRASSDSTRRSTGRAENPANCATTRRCCSGRWRACSRRSMAGAELRHT